MNKSDGNSDTSADMKSPEWIDTIKLGDCIQLMQEMPDRCVDLVITDPPFAIDFKAPRGNYKRKGSHVLQGYNEIQGSAYPELRRI